MTLYYDPAALAPRGLTPWAVRGEHRWCYAMTMLRMEGLRRAGAELTARDTERLEVWIANLREGDLVVHYEPDTDHGFVHVPRRPGVDADLIREL